MAVKSLAFILGGGEGKRLHPLTKDRAKPAVPFGGSYRVIDFALSNLAHSGIKNVVVLAQYKHDSLEKHLELGWKSEFLSREASLSLVHSSNGKTGWYAGTADALYQNRDRLENGHEVVNVFGGDHIYFMDVSKMNHEHMEKGAQLTISALPVKREIARKKFGVLEVDDNGWVVGFQEKPENPASIPGQPEWCYASMGNYAFHPRTLWNELSADAKKKIESADATRTDPETFTTHDIGFDLIPDMLRKGLNVRAYNFQGNTWDGSVMGEHYWEDIGTVDTYYQANRDLCTPLPKLNLYNEKWRVWTYMPVTSAFKKVGANEIKDSLMANGVIVSNSSVADSILSFNTVLEGAVIEGALLLGNNRVGKGARVRKTILDKHVSVPDGVEIGFDEKLDRERGFEISAGGIVVVPRRYHFESK